MKNYFEPNGAKISSQDGIITYSLPFKKKYSFQKILKDNLSNPPYKKKSNEIPPNNNCNETIYEVLVLNQNIDKQNDEDPFGECGTISFSSNGFALNSTTTNIHNGNSFDNGWLYTAIIPTVSSEVNPFTGFTSSSSGSGIFSRIWNGIKGFFNNIFNTKKKTGGCLTSSKPSKSSKPFGNVVNHCYPSSSQSNMSNYIEYDFTIPLPNELFDNVTKDIDCDCLIESIYEVNQFNNLTEEFKNQYFNCACENDNTKAMSNFLQLNDEQANWYNKDKNVFIRQKNCAFIKTNNYSTQSQNFAKLSIENNSTKYINENFELTKKSPFNVDITQILDSIALPTNDPSKAANQKFLCLYEKLTTSNSYKNLFTNIFGGNQNVLNAQFKITKDLKNSNGDRKNGLRTVLPRGTRVNGVITKLNVLIEIDQDLLTGNSNYNAIKTILHESIHAYLTLKKLNCGQFSSFGQYNNDEIGETIETYYNNFSCNGTQSQHEFMFDYMLPTFKTVFEEIGRLNFTSQANINGLSTYDLQIMNQLIGTNSHMFDWNEFYLYNSLPGLHNTTSFQNEVQNNSIKNELYKAYREVGEKLLGKDCN